MRRSRAFAVALCALAAALAASCSNGEAPAPAPTPTARPFPASSSILRSLPVGYRTEVLLDGLDMPTALASTPDGRLLIAEQRSGRVRVVRDGVLEPEPWVELPVYAAEQEQIVQELGLVSIAVDPRFEENGFVYVYYTDGPPNGARRSVLARLRDEDGRGVDLTEVLTVDLAPERRHIGGGIAFLGETLLVGTGDHEQAALAQSLTSLAGKVLRIDRDGGAPADNPFAGREDADPRVYAYGLRNPYGVASDPETGRAFITENREVAGDAVYQLEAGADYGWPDHEEVLREPLVFFTRRLGPAGITVYRGGALPELDGDLFFCTFHVGGALHRASSVPTDDPIARESIVAPSCTSGVTVGADGFIYFLDFGTGRLMRISR